MKRFFLCFSMFFASVLAIAQTDVKEKATEMAGLIVKEYNSQNYKAIHKMMDKEFRTKLNEKELSDFFKYNIQDIYGDISKVDYLESSNGMHIFLVQTKNGQLDLALSYNADGKISAMQWLPHKDKLPEPTSLKNNKYNSDNAGATVMDLKIDSLVKNYMSNGANCGLSIAIYQDKEIKYYNYGDVKRGANQLPSNKTIYEIGSISKTFTGILLAQAVNDRKLYLNDPVKKHLGEGYDNLAYKGKDVELVHLANHSGRIHRIPFNLMAQPGYNEQNPYKNYNRAMVLEYMKKVQPDTFPGTKNDYSNLGMALLGIIEEKAYGKTYEALITEFICKPIGMPDTKIILTEEDTKRFATGYDLNGNETSHWEFGDLPGCGAIRSTSEDMLKYAKANLEEATTAIKLSHYTTFNNGRDHVGLGWHLMTTKKGNELIWHNGRTGGFSSFCGIIKSKNVAVVVLSNSGNPVDPIAIGILKLLQ